MCIKGGGGGGGGLPFIGLKSKSSSGFYFHRKNKVAQKRNSKLFIYTSFFTILYCKVLLQYSQCHGTCFIIYSWCIMFLSWFFWRGTFLAIFCSQDKQTRIGIRTSGNRERATNATLHIFNTKRVRDTKIFKFLKNVLFYYKVLRFVPLKMTFKVCFFLI